MAKKKKAAKRKQPHKDPKGGLTAAGRRAYKKNEGANLKPSESWRLLQIASEWAPQRSLANNYCRISWRSSRALASWDPMKSKFLPTVPRPTRRQTGSTS